MPRFNKNTGTYSRSNDFPDIGDYPVSDLREACRFYHELRRTKEEVSALEFQDHFDCSPHKARVLLSAAEFQYKMHKKGMA